MLISDLLKGSELIDLWLAKKFLLPSGPRGTQNDIGFFNGKPKLQGHQ
jgi:hypothetical protein